MRWCVVVLLLCLPGMSGAEVLLVPEHNPKPDYPTTWSGRASQCVSRQTATGNRAPGLDRPVQQAPALDRAALWAFSCDTVCADAAEGDSRVALAAVGGIAVDDAPYLFILA
jgi:hypothetical protein